MANRVPSSHRNGPSIPRLSMRPLKCLRNIVHLMCPKNENCRTPRNEITHPPLLDSNLWMPRRRIFPIQRQRCCFSLTPCISRKYVSCTAQNILKNTHEYEAISWCVNVVYQAFDSPPPRPSVLSSPLLPPPLPVSPAHYIPAGKENSTI